MLQILGTLNRAFEHEIDKKKSNFRVQGMYFSRIVLILTDTIWPMPPCINATISIIKSLHYNFPKMMGGSKALWNFPKMHLIW